MPKKEDFPEPDADQARLFVWVKGLESKVNNLLRELDILKNDYIKKNTALRQEVKALSGEMLEVKREQVKTLEKMDLMIRELKNTAGIEELQTLKKYIDFWNPMHFVTQRDLDRAIEAKLGVVEHAMDDEEGEKTNKKEKHIPFV